MFAGLDCTQSYWHLLLHTALRVCQSIISTDGVFTPTSALDGTTNSVFHLQSFLSSKLPPALRDHVLLWVNNCLFHEQSIPALLQYLRVCFQFCVDCNWKLNPIKCNLFSTEARLCGRVTSAYGIRHDTSKLDDLCSMKCPTAVGQRQLFVWAMQWLRSALPGFQSLVQDLHEFFELVYTHVGRCTKRAIAHGDLFILGWQSLQAAAFEPCNNFIIHGTTLPQHDNSKRLFFFADAIYSHWWWIITQVPSEQLTILHKHQAHNHLAFHSNLFSHIQLGW